MKKVFILIVVIFALSVSIFNVKESKAAPPDPRCLSFEVTFTAKNWKEGPIQIGCQGLNAGPCTGGILTDVRPKQGKKYLLHNCACPQNNRGQEKNWADGCLYVAKELKKIKRTDSENRPGVDVKHGINSKCTINTNVFENVVKNGQPVSGFYKTKDDTNYCGLNKTTVPVPIRITCPGPTVVVTYTNTPTPTSCPAPSPVTNVRIKCPECRQSTPTVSPINTQTTTAPTAAATAVPTAVVTRSPITTQETGGDE